MARFPNALQQEQSQLLVLKSYSWDLLKRHSESFESERSRQGSFSPDLLRSYRTHKVVGRTFKLSFIILMVAGVFIYFERTRRTEQM